MRTKASNPSRADHRLESAKMKKKANSSKLHRWTYLFVPAMVIFLAGGILLLSQTGISSNSKPARQGSTEVAKVISNMPLYFIENQGQIDPSVAYYIQQGGANIYFTAKEMVMALPKTKLNVRFVAANPAVKITGAKKQEARINYMIGNEKSKWRTNIPTYGEITYHELWPGIDVTYTGKAGRLKYTFVVQPGADPAAIRLAYDGIDRLSLDEDGSLRIAADGEKLGDTAPDVYQEINGTRVKVESCFKLHDAHTYGYSIEAYDQRHSLVIDPELDLALQR